MDIPVEKYYAVQVLLTEWQQVINNYHQGADLQWRATLEAKALKKYLRVVKYDAGSTSAAAFIDPETGDIFKAASWSSPAKTARGNIFSDRNGMEAIDNMGYVKYL